MRVLFRPSSLFSANWQLPLVPSTKKWSASAVEFSQRDNSYVKWIWFHAANMLLQSAMGTILSLLPKSALCQWRPHGPGTLALVMCFRGRAKVGVGMKIGVRYVQVKELAPQ